MKEIGYQNAGTVEFLFKDWKVLLHGSQCKNTGGAPYNGGGYRSGHSRTTVNIALHKGLAIKQGEIKSRGHAIECRINAEHPFSFIPFARNCEKSSLLLKERVSESILLYILDTTIPISTIL